MSELKTKLNNINDERNTLNVELNILKAGQDSLKIERDIFKAQRDALEVKLDSLKDVLTGFKFRLEAARQAGPNSQFLVSIKVKALEQRAKLTSLNRILTISFQGDRKDQVAPHHDVNAGLSRYREVVSIEQS